MREAEQHRQGVPLCTLASQPLLHMYISSYTYWVLNYVHLHKMFPKLSRSGKMAGILGAVRCDVLTAYDWIMYNESIHLLRKIWQIDCNTIIIVHVRVNVTSFSLSLGNLKIPFRKHPFARVYMFTFYINIWIIPVQYHIRVEISNFYD